MRRLAQVALAAVVAAACFITGAVSTGSAAPSWAPAATAAIHPGVQTYSPSGQCTSNFIFFDASDVYIGQAAHCTGTGGATETNGCDSGSLPLGTQVEIDGASQPGVMVYNSWLAMQAAGETDPNACAYNDFALIRIAPADVGMVNPSIPHWGGPVGLNPGGPTAGQTVYTYGNSSLRLGLTQVSPKTGTSIGDGGNGWTHDVYTATPGIPGDSGSAFLDSRGRALGVLSTVQLAPLAGSNGVGDLRLELAYLASHSSLAVQLALGTEPFNPNQVPLGLPIPLPLGL
jgi:hypothetical protein